LPRAYRIELTRAAERDLRGLSRDVLRRVDRKIQALSNDPRPHGAKKLEGRANTYRVRVGDYRILYEVEDTAILVLVVRVGHRREVYER
jgi:mRNA interferase RelE/StbE